MPEKTTFERWVEVARSIVEIAAILIGGVWAYQKFMRIEAPAFAPNFKITSSLDWSGPIGSPSCLVDVSLDIVNNSKLDTEIQKVVRRAWFVERPKELKELKGIVYFDPLVKRDLGVPADSDEYLEGPLIQSYPPGASIHQGFTWFVEARPNAYAVFRIDLFSKREDKEPLDFHYAWGPACEGLAQPESKPLRSNRPTRAK